MNFLTLLWECVYMDKYYDEFANVFFCVRNVRNEIKHVLKNERKYGKKKKCFGKKVGK